jgi:leader peptidase (prepilin peptidase) / N-methyltransferase
MAALFAARVLTAGTGDGGALALGIAFCAMLVVVTLTDLERRVIPNPVLLAGATVAVALALATDPGSLPTRAIAAAIAGGGLLLLALAYPRGMGMGDVKLAAVMGLYLGRSVAPAVLIGFGAGALAGLVMIVRRGASARKQAVPFGPFLALGGMVALWFGAHLVDWYLGSFSGP